MNTTDKIKRRIENLSVGDLEALTVIAYFLPKSMPLKMLLDKPDAIFAADSATAADIHGRLQAEGLITVDADDFIRLSTGFELTCECDICEFLPPAPYLQNKKSGETFVGCVFSALEKSDEAMCKIWSQALKRACEMLIRNPESETDPDLPRFFNRLRLACELLGEDEQARYWEKKLLEYHRETYIKKL